MFTGRILNMSGGEMPRQDDVRTNLLHYSGISHLEPCSLRVKLSKTEKKYASRKIPLQLNDPTTGDRLSIPTPYHVNNLINQETQLSKQLGHQTVRDILTVADNDSSIKYGDKNLLYSGYSTVEYDLVLEDAKTRKRFLYCDPDVLEIEAQECIRVDDYKTGLGENADVMMYNMTKRIEEIGEEMNGPVVSEGSLLAEVMMTIRLYMAETARVERMSMQPFARNLLWGPTPDLKDGVMFRVVFLSNISFMGLKVVFYPTALEPSSICSSAQSQHVTQRRILLAAQVALMTKSMPGIVERVEKIRASRNISRFLAIDLSGSYNLNFPGHTKNVVDSLPYHATTLERVDDTDILEISNKKMVTSLGVVECGPAAKEWLNVSLDAFEKRNDYADAIGKGLIASDTNAWRRDVLFSDTGFETPFKDKSAFVDADVYLSGLCFMYLSSNPTLFIGSGESGGGNSSNNSSVDQAKQNKNSDDDATVPHNNADKAPPVPTLKENIIKGYNQVISNLQVLLIILSGCIDSEENNGFVMKEGNVMKLAMKVLNCVDSRTAKKKLIKDDTSQCTKKLIDSLKMSPVVSQVASSDPDFITLSILSLLQLVIRSEFKAGRLKIAGDTYAVCIEHVKTLTYNTLNLKNVWESAYVDAQTIDKGGSLSGVSSIEPVEQPHVSNDKAAKSKHNSLLIDSIVNSYQRTFASQTNSNDTMFLWTVVTMAERFCAMYNAVRYPRLFYDSVVETGMMYDGGFERFEKFCAEMLPELEAFIPPITNNNNHMSPSKPGVDHGGPTICRRAVKGREMKFERMKNETNYETCRVKVNEMVNEENIKEKYKDDLRDRGDYEDEDVFLKRYTVAGNTTEEFESLFHSMVLENLTTRIREEEKRKKEERLSLNNEIEDVDDLLHYNNHGSSGNEIEFDEETSDEVLKQIVESGTGVQRDIDTFFYKIDLIKSTESKRILCHRQQYVSPHVVGVIGNYMGEIVCGGKTTHLEKRELLTEIRRRSKVVSQWVVPYTFPVEKIPINFNKKNNCCGCFQRCIGQDGFIENNGACIDLLFIPNSTPLEDLTHSLRFNTMAVERRYIADPSVAFGFITANTSSSSSSSSVSNHERWKACLDAKTTGGEDSLLGYATDYLPLYQNVVKRDDELAKIIEPRTRALNTRDSSIYESKSKFEQKTVDTKYRKGMEALFSGIWALASRANITTSVVAGTIRNPTKPTEMWLVGPKEDAVRKQQIAASKLASESMRTGAIYISGKNKGGLLTVFTEMSECSTRTKWPPPPLNYSAKEDTIFFQHLTIKYGKSNKAPGATMWTVLDSMKSCTLNSLPLDWSSISSNWSEHVLNLCAGAPNTDESGAVYEMCTFLTACVRLFAGQSVNDTLGKETWKQVLSTDYNIKNRFLPTWVYQLARVYEKSVDGADTRILENFIDSSDFLTANNIASKLNIKRTTDSELRQHIWNDNTILMDDSCRVKFMVAFEKSNSNEFSFSFVLMCVCLYRLCFENETVESLCDTQREWDATLMMPLLRTLSSVNKSWAKTYMNSVPKTIVNEYIEQNRFSDIESDYSMYYNTAAYMLGLLANKDDYFEKITRRITDSFDFNGFDTSNWDTFIDQHFSNFILGKRARMLSIPMSFLKRVVAEVSKDNDNDVKTVVSNLGNLVLTKRVESSDVNTTDIITCCILQPSEDLTVTSPKDYYLRVTSDRAPVTSSRTNALNTNACDNSRLAKIKNAPRLLDTSVSFMKTQPEGHIELDEEEVIDPSIVPDKDENLVNPTATRGVESGKDQQRKQNQQQNNKKPKVQTPQREHVVANDCVGFSDGYIITKSDSMLKQVSNLMREDMIKSKNNSTIDRLCDFMLITSPFYDITQASEVGLSNDALERGRAAIVRWNKIVKQEASVAQNECLTEEISDMYDTTILNAGTDYPSSRRATFQSEEDVIDFPTLDKTKSQKISDDHQSNDGGGSEKRKCLYSSNTSSKKKKNDNVVVVDMECDEEMAKLAAGDKTELLQSMFCKQTAPIDGSQMSTRSIRVAKKPSRYVWRQQNQVNGNGTLALYNTSTTAADNKTKYKFRIPHRDMEKSDNELDITLSEELKFATWRYGALKKLWLCNNGVHPKDQVSMYKKLVFRNVNCLWVKVYSKLIETFNRWGFITHSNYLSPTFKILDTCELNYVKVDDVNPPNSVLHAQNLSKVDVISIVQSSRNIGKYIKNRETLYEQSRSEEQTEGRPMNELVNNDELWTMLRKGVVGRELIATLFDRKRNHMTSPISNALSLFFTPGTNIENMHINPYGREDDVDYSGNESFLHTTSFERMNDAVETALVNGAFSSDSVIDGKSRTLHIVSDDKGSDLLEHYEKLFFFLVQNVENQRKFIVPSSFEKDEQDTMKHHAGVSVGHFLDEDDLYMPSIRLPGDRSFFEECAILQKKSDWIICHRVLLDHWTSIVASDNVNSNKQLLNVVDVSQRRRCLPAIHMNNRNGLDLPKCALKTLNPHATKMTPSYKRGTACFLAEPVFTVSWFLNRVSHKLVLSVSNDGTAERSRLMCKKSGLRQVNELKRNGTLTDIGGQTNAGACMSVEYNRYFLFNDILLGGRLEDINLNPGTFIRVKIHAEKVLIFSAVAPQNLVSAMLAVTVDGPPCVRGLALLEHTSRMTNASKDTSKDMDFWSNHSKTYEPMDCSTDETTNVYPSTESSTSSLLMRPSISIADADYVFLSILYELASLDISKLHDKETNRVCMRALRKCYTSLVNQKTGTPVLHLVYLFRSILNFGGFIGAITTGDGEKTHHLLYTLASIGLNMASKMGLAMVGVSGNNLKTTLAETLTNCWWCRTADGLNVSAFDNGSSNVSSSQVNLAHIGGRKSIAIMDEAGYQGSSAASVKHTRTTRSNNDSKNSNTESISCVLTKDNIWETVEKCLKNTLVDACTQEIISIKLDKNSGHVHQQQVDITTNKSAKPIAQDAFEKPRIFIRCGGGVFCWWNNEKGGVVYAASERKTSSSVICCGGIPYVINNANILFNSQWLKRGDAVLRAICYGADENGASGDTKYRTDEVDAAVTVLLGNDSNTPSRSAFANILSNSTGFIKDDDEEEMVDYIVNNSDAELLLKKKEWVKNIRSLKRPMSEVIERMHMTLKQAGSLIEWNVTTAKDGSSCLAAHPTNKVFENMINSATVGQTPFLGEESTIKAANVLYAFHVLHLGKKVCGQSKKPRVIGIPIEPNITSWSSYIGDKLYNVNPLVVADASKCKSEWLLSVVHGSDSNIKNATTVPVDGYLVDMLGNPNKYGFPTITFEGNRVFPQSKESANSLKDNVTVIHSMMGGGDIGLDGSVAREFFRRFNTNSSTSAGDQDGENTLQQSLDFFLTAQHSHTNNNDRTTASAASTTNRYSDLYKAMVSYKNPNYDISAMDVATTTSNFIEPPMLPGQFNSSILKLITSPRSVLHQRGLHCKPVPTSVTMTPIFMSNSHTFKFHVDLALSKRLLVFSFNTLFEFTSKNVGVTEFNQLTNTGLKVIHADLVCRRAQVWSPQNKLANDISQRNLDELINTWNNDGHLRGCSATFTQAKTIIAALPSFVTQQLVKNSVLEMKDSTDTAKVEESGNTFFTLYSPLLLNHFRSITMPLSSPPPSKKNLTSTSDPELFATDKVQGHNKMCTVSPKSLLTLQMAMEMSKTGLVEMMNAAMRCAVLVTVPFVDTIGLYGEGCTLRCLTRPTEGKPSMDISWMMGLQLPNCDMNVKGYSHNSMMGAGEAISRQMLDAWGSHDIRNGMYSCFHLNMLYELAFQFSFPKRRLNPQEDGKKEFLSMVVMTLMYADMMKKLGFNVFKTTGQKTTTTTSDDVDVMVKPLTVPLFPFLIINKPLSVLRATTNLSFVGYIAGEASKHVNLISRVLGVLSMSLNPKYVCESCKK